VRTTILNDFLVLTGVTVIAALALLFASRASIFVPDPDNTGSSCSANTTELDELMAANGDNVVVRLQPPGSTQARSFKVENTASTTTAVSIVRHSDLTETDAEALRSSGLYEEMGLRISNVQICYKAHIEDNSHGRMRLAFSIRQHQNLALVENARIAEGAHENKSFNKCILQIFEGMAFMPPLGDDTLPEAGALMVFYPVEVL
jgi:hypothetical protein